jgi:hypothetical protein
MHERGMKLVSECKQHLLAVMSGIPECSPDGPGARNADIELAAGLRLDLPVQDRWLTWSLLSSLGLDGKIEVLKVGQSGHRRYRLASQTAE